MKRIVAFIKPNMLTDVIQALHEVSDFPGAAISEVKGIGRGISDHVKESNHEPFHGMPHSVRLESICVDDMADEIVKAIETNAHTGLPDDGKIYVSSVEEAIRIRTGERGDAAV